jgi:hypothetical protein
MGWGEATGLALRQRIQRETVRLRPPSDRPSTVHERLVLYFHPQTLVEAWTKRTRAVELLHT